VTNRASIKRLYARETRKKKEVRCFLQEGKEGGEALSSEWGKREKKGEGLHLKGPTTACHTSREGEGVSSISSRGKERRGGLRQKGKQANLWGIVGKKGAPLASRLQERRKKRGGGPHRGRGGDLNRCRFRL